MSKLISKWRQEALEIEAAGLPYQSAAVKITTLRSCADQLENYHE